MKLKIISLLISLLVTLPMWLFMIYSILISINADRLVWFIFYAYIPISILSQIIAKIAESEDIE